MVWDLLALALLVSAGTAINFLIKRWVAHASPFRLSAQRLILGGLLALVIGGALLPSALLEFDLLKLAVSGLLMFAVAQALVFAALKTQGAQPADVAMIEAVLPVGVFLYARKDFAVGSRGLQLGALECAAIAGLLVFLGAASWKGLRRPSREHLLVFASALATTAGVVLLWALSSDGSPPKAPLQEVAQSLIGTGWAALAGGLATLSLWNAAPAAAPIRTNWLHVLGLAVIGTLVGWTPVTWLARSNSSGLLIGVGVILIPVATLLWTAFRGRKAIPGHQWVGALLVIAASAGIMLTLNE